MMPLLQQFPCYWRRFCLGFIGVLLSIRFLHYQLPPFSEALDTVFGQLLWFQLLGMFASMTFIMPQVPLAVILLILLIRRRQWLFFQENGQWRASGWLECWAWFNLLTQSVFLDLNPSLALMAWAALLGFWIRHKAYFLILAFTSLVWLSTPAETVAFLTWLFWLQWWILKASIRVWDKAWFAIISLVLLQYGCSVYFSILAPHHGKVFSQNFAYTFCEIPEQQKLIAIVPACDGLSKRCLDGAIEEYDRQTLERQAKHYVLHDQFYGRLEQGLCLQDSVQVGMAELLFEGHRKENFNTLEFNLDSQQVSQETVGPGWGPRVVHDSQNDALFYVGTQLHRIDRNTGESTDLTHLLSNDESFFISERHSIHQKRQSLFLSELISGDDIHELDLTTLTIKNSFQGLNGGSISVTVDEPLGRLYITGMWGFEVYDLKTQKRLLRKRTGFATRIVEIDEKHELLYVPSTLEGKIRVYDRNNLDWVGVIPIGFGIRNIHLINEGNTLVACSTGDCFSWDAAQMRNTLENM